MHDETQIRQLLDRIRATATDSFVVSISDHVAGYFDELGITIEVDTYTKDSQVAALSRKLAALLLPEQLPSKWMVMFSRNGQSAGVLFPDGMFTGPEP